MYSKEIASAIRSRFFTKLGQYLHPIASSNGQKVNWINYKTGVKQIYFRIDLPNRGCEIGLEICSADADLRKRQFHLLETGRSILDSDPEIKWTWSESSILETGAEISRVFDRLDGVSVLNESDWPVLISFIKPRLLLLDRCWQEVKELFI